MIDISHFLSPAIHRRRLTLTVGDNDPKLQTGLFHFQEIVEIDLIPGKFDVKGIKSWFIDLSKKISYCIFQRTICLPKQAECY